jgi:hypothetical protein
MLLQMPLGVRSSLNQLQDTIHVEVSASVNHETLRGSDEHQQTVLGKRLKRTELAHPHVMVKLGATVTDSSRKELPKG